MELPTKANHHYTSSSPSSLESFDCIDVKLEAPTLSKPWNSRTLLAQFSHSPSHTTELNVELHPSFSNINQSSLETELHPFGGIEGLEVSTDNGIHGDSEDIASRHQAFGSNTTYRKDGPTTLIKHRKRWRLALVIIRILRSLAKEVVASRKKQINFSKILQSSLTKLMKQKNPNQLLHEFGGVKGLALALKTDAEKGIRGYSGEIASRQQAFGSNIYGKPPERSFFNYVLATLRDSIILILLVCAALSLGFGIIKHGFRNGWWYEGGSIFVAVFVVITLPAVINFGSNRQLEKLSAQVGNNNIRVNVVRNGRPRLISTFEIVVGDVVCLKIGDQVPADGLLLRGDSLPVDESSMTGESECVKSDHNHNRFLLFGTNVADGNARMLVTSVGMNTAWGQRMSSRGREPTPLQAGVNKIASSIRKAGLAVAFLVFVVLLVRYFLGNIEDENGNRAFIGRMTKISDVFKAIMGILATAVAIAAGANPEGLALAVTITLAYSVKRLMHDDWVLVRKLSACETIGLATTICSNKTGILILNPMEVTKFWLGQKFIEKSLIIEPNVRELILQGVGMNTTCAPSGRASFELSGSPTEKAIFIWAHREMGMDINVLNASCTILPVEAFNSEKKLSGVCMRKNADDTNHVHLKGAPEVILKLCSHYYETTGNVHAIDNRARAEMEQIIQGMTANGGRCIAFAHKQISKEDYDDGKCHQKLKENCFTLLGLMGLDDPCRVRKAVEDCRCAGVNIQMITGDDVILAKDIATECGILKPNQDTTSGEVVEGAEFENYTTDERMEKVERIRVMARASSIHKLLVVKCLKEKGHIVAVTGDGTVDAPGLREAHIGLCMGTQSTDMANESSDIVILNDNFDSVVTLLSWGRGIYNNIQILTQFQLTASVASLVVDFVTAVSAGEPTTINIVATISAGEVPYAALQLLWVKLILGSLAALALTIERPTQELMQKQPVGRTDPLITNVMWKNIMAQAMYQIAILLTIQFKGESIFHVKAEVKDTLIFNISVLNQVFAIFNARKLEKNLFVWMHTKKLFLGIIGIIIVLQVVMVEFLTKFAGTERLDWVQWIACIGIAALSRLVGWSVKCIPVPEKPFLSYLGKSKFKRSWSAIYKTLCCSLKKD